MVCLIVGDANADLSASLEFFPHEGDDAAITALAFQSGGTAANVAVAYARLGGASRLVTRVGEDPAAEVALRAAKRAGVDLSFVQRDADVTTGLCFAAISPSGERTFFSHRGANVALGLPDVDRVFQDAHALHVSGHALLDGEQRSTALELIDAAIQRQLPVSVDLCLPLVRKRVTEIMKLAPRLSVIFANAHELSLLGSSLGFTGNESEVIDSALAALAHAGAPLVVAKLGALGSRIAKGSSRFDIPPWPVTAIDTTGAGDGFVAAFLFVFLREGSVETAARVANVVGALVASRSGAAEASPTHEEVCAVLEKQGAIKALDVFTRPDQRIEP
ncbi:MAG: carbohydrate kinase family protein [Polyangiaceae bacterium]|nr:carbohydrate kinase family protein [Polyangiaceae bacterium]